MLAYHNTFVFDDASSTAGNTYGFYQTGVANGVNFRNNIVYITRSGGAASIRRTFQFVTATSTINSNNNGFYFAPTTGANNNFGTIGAVNYAAFTDWQSATSYDQVLSLIHI